MSLTCPACTHENRDGRRFCTQCGVPLAPKCSACGGTIEAGERFCGDCGAPVESVPATGSPSPAAPEPEGERKQVTVLFADVQGSMELQEDMDPEVWAEIMARFVQINAEGIRRFGGTVDKFTGDGIMALFGAPLAQEDHARRACHAAWHLIHAVAAYAEELRASHGVDLHARLGLNSGEVVVTRVGEDLRLDPTALGHAVGLAQRMESRAEAGTAYLTEHTARLVEGWFRLRDLGHSTVKGAREPLRIFVLEGPDSTRLRGTVRTLGVVPMVGRDREVAVLSDALAAASEGRAQVVGVVGEAGVGKSRLCEEFAASAAAQGVTVRRTSGVSHGKDLPLIPILAFLRDYFGITAEDGPDRARAKISDYLLSLDPALEEKLPLLYDFLEVPEVSGPSPVVAPEVRLSRLFEALRRVTQRRSEQEVLLLLAEDLHWFDPQSEAFLERVIESFPGSRTLVVANFRPEFSAAWMRHSYYRQLAISPLPEAGVSDLLERLVGEDSSMGALVGFVVERTGGNPFFVEEVVRALVEDGTLDGVPGAYRLTRPLHDVKVPAGVQAVLAARIDRLPQVHKDVLQAAAVIGRTFPESVLRDCVGLSADVVIGAVDGLCAAELLVQGARGPAPDYRFWHPLTQEVAYRSLLSARRARLHGAVARAWVAADSAAHDERAALIASHYAQAGDHLEAARWEDRAATWGQNRDLADSARRWRVVLAHLDHEQQTDECIRLGVRARLQLLRSGTRTGISREESDAWYLEAKGMSERLDDPALLVMVMYSRGVELCVRGDIRLGHETWLEAADRAAGLADAGLRAVVFLAAAISSAWVGPVNLGLHYAELAEQTTGGDPTLGAAILGFSPLVRTVSFHAELLATAGQLEAARREAERALELAGARSEPFTVAGAISLLARLADLTDEAPLDPARISEAATLADDPGDLVVRVVAQQALSYHAMATGDAITARARTRDTLALAREHRFGLEEPRMLALLARSELAAGDDASAIAAADEAVEVARRQGVRTIEVVALLTRAQVRRAVGADPAAILSDLDVGLALAEETGARIYEPFFHEELGRLGGDDAELRLVAELYRAIGAGAHARRLEGELTARSGPAT